MKCQCIQNLLKDLESALASKFSLKKTTVALELYGKNHDANVVGTILLLRIVVKWWTILHMKNNALNQRNRQLLQAVSFGPEITRLKFILEFGRMCLKMSGAQGKRIKQLSKDEATRIYQACHGLVELSRHLLYEETY